MDHADAVNLIHKGADAAGGVWADLGAGSGVFTRALGTLLGKDGLVYAVDRAPQDWFRQPPRGAHEQARIIGREADFTQPLDLQELHGILMANALHFVRHPEPVLTRLVS